ncbi:MAG TPA: hypothetical protein VMD56_06290 [Steroidobacteraceae bacterium]|nr:hypothetical protein [Steroidobacteraceae bacterium]
MNRRSGSSRARPRRRPGGASPLALGLLGLLSLVPATGRSAGRGPPPIDACALLTADELAALLGMPVEAGVRHDDGLTSIGAYSSTCLWKVRNARLRLHDPQASLGGADFAILDVFSWPTQAAARRFLQSFRAAAQSNLIPTQPLPLHIGDESLWWGDGVAVRRGAVSFGVSVVVNSADRDRRRAWEESLASRIVARIHSGGR